MTATDTESRVFSDDVTPDKKYEDELWIDNDAK